MNFWQIGSVSQYTKGLARQTQWKLKKQSGDLSAHYKSLTDQVSFTKASDVFPYQDERDDKLSAIITKAQAGKKLSPDEWDYVRAKRPELYAQLRQLEEETKAYEEELKHCKTKDEAQRLHMIKLSGVMAQAKNGDESALIRLNRLTQTMTAFTESQSYHEIPSEAEEAIERENQRQAKVEAMQAEAEVQKEARQQALAEVAQDTSNDAPDNPRQVAAEAATNSLEQAVSGSEEAHDKVPVPEQYHSATDGPGPRVPSPPSHFGFTGEKPFPEHSGGHLQPKAGYRAHAPVASVQGRQAYLSQSSDGSGETNSPVRRKGVQAKA